MARIWEARETRWILLLAFLAFLLRVAFDLRVAPYPWPDTSKYLQAAADLLHTGRIGSDIMMPLYPLLLGVVGSHYVIAVQAVLSAATASVAAILAREIFHSTFAAVAAGLLAAFDPVEIFYADQRLTETLFTFLFLLALLLLYRRRYFAGSVAIVLSILVRPTFDLLALPLLAALVWANEDSFTLRRFARLGGIYLAVYITLLSPWWWHNYEKYGAFVRLDLGDGPIFRLEQSPQFAKYGFEWQKLEPVFHEFDDVEDPVLRDALFRRAAIEYIRANPWRYVKLCVRRFGRFWSPVIDQDDNFSPRKVRMAAFAMTVFIYALSFFALFSVRAPDRKRLLPLLLVIAYLMTVHTLLHALPRYRVPIEPLLCVLASGAVLRLGSPVKSLTLRTTKEREHPIPSEIQFRNLKT